MIFILVVATLILWFLIADRYAERKLDADRERGIPHLPRVKNGVCWHGILLADCDVCQCDIKKREDFLKCSSRGRYELHMERELDLLKKECPGLEEALLGHPPSLQQDPPL